MADGLRALIAQQEDFEIVGDVSRQDVLGAVEKHSPDVAVVLSPALTIENSRELSSLSTFTKVVLVARAENVWRSMEAVRIGVRAVVAPDSSAEALLQTLRTVVASESYVVPAAAQMCVDTLVQPQVSDATLRLAATLTPREKEILLFLARGSTNAEIAAKLSVSTATIRSHVHHLLGKLGLGTRTQAVAVAYMSGLLSTVERQLDSHQ
ncbi:DNA-binding response regulator [Streptomyces sp. CG1]|uniref:response regulator transcription factor n=1 Tax=Streptomyces sp. CG1 TaxID=1287523 RepID=UPI0034E1CB91